MPSRISPQLHCQSSVASMSLGRAAHHSLSHKLDMAAKYGIKGIELFYEDLESYTIEMFQESTPNHLIKAAREIKTMCDDKGLEINCLQPFMHYEGLLDRNKHAERVEELRLWCTLVRTLGTGLIGLPSSFLNKDEITGDLDVIVCDLQEAADVAAEQDPPIRLAYEGEQEIVNRYSKSLLLAALAWGTYVDRWEQSWDIVQKVQRSNFGLCLDTFNIAARIYADPTAKSGKTPEAEDEVIASCRRLKETVDTSKVFFLQVVDAEQLDQPLVKGHPFYSVDQPARMSWSRNCRLFYGEQERGAYLPVKQILKMIVNTLGYRGWLSAELFNRSMADPAPCTPAEHARRAAAAWKAIIEDIPECIA